MFKSLIKYLIVFLISIAVVYQYQGYIAQLRLIPVGIIKLIFPENRVEPLVNKNISKDNLTSEILSANSFEVYVDEVPYFSGYNINQDGSLNNQHKSAGLYGKFIKNETLLELYTRDGSLITKNTITQFELPRNYDSHNSQGGIRGIFFLNDEPYAYMATKKIGCQNMSIISLKSKVEIFETDCLPDYIKIHFDGVGGASMHYKENILLSVGAPTNNSDLIRNLAQNNESNFGKIISINKASILNKETKAKVKNYTSGHRNPQGLAKVKGNIFSAEHGPHGGDELNILKENANYGWPIASYGTSYERGYVSASYKLNHKKNNFMEPLMQFTPSVAISDLTNCSKQLIKHYNREGCLIATTLRDKSLVIILLSDNFSRVIGYEKIEFGERLRHIAKRYDGELFQEDDGSIYITSDSGMVLKVKFKLIKD